jgi:CRISPR/Cas system-associated exonuclease Cas4 (RecB family)
MVKSNKHSISASELKQWDYCPRQWYLLKTTGSRVNNRAVRLGREFHQKQAQGVKAVRNTQSLLTKFILTGGIACLFWFLLQLR